MRFDVITIFPRMIEAGIGDGVVHRGVERGLLQVGVHDLRDHATDRHRTVDDVPYGGGPGMVMKVEPFARAVEYVSREQGSPDAVVMLSPQGARFPQRTAERLAAEDSFSRGLLDHPHYTRPAEFAGRRVPDVLLSGHHQDVRNWRRRAAVVRTCARRPELLADVALADDERVWLNECQKEMEK